MRNIPFAGIELTSQRVRGLRGTSELPGRPAVTKDSIVLHLLGIFIFLFFLFFLFFSEKNSSYRDSNSRPNVSEGYEVTN